MGNAKEAKAEKEELKKLEDQAYFELCQIIAEAMQLQDIELLDYRISYWKNRYKKLLDGFASPEFKKKIEYLLNEYYSSVTQYIYSQIKFKENKKIENQSKALTKLYRIIKETNDLETLKSKVKDWEKKYPKSSFLRMYQRKIDSYTRTKNLEANAFNQEEAFSDLVDITKHNNTFEEFIKEREEWEKKYSIHDKFELDDFIKHQTEIKRYSSDDYLQSISKEELNPEELSGFAGSVSTTEPTQEESSSDLSKQASAYSSLLSISKKPNNVNEMFKWIYKNNSIKFNDKYSELILNATYLDYSPTYLNKLKAPDLNINNSSLSYKEFKEMDDIKRYAIISYFNLLLPPDKAIPNVFFNSCINTVYLKTEKARFANSSLTELNQESLKNGIEIKLSKPDAEQELDLPELKNQDIPNTDVKEVPSSIAKEKQNENADSAKKLQEDLPINPDKHIKEEESKKEDEMAIASSVLINLASKSNNKIEAETESKDKEMEPSTIQDTQKEPNISKEYTATAIDLEIEEEPSKVLAEKPIEEPRIDVFLNNSFEKPIVEETENVKPEPLQQEQIVAISPLFFSAINYKAKQAEAVKKIDEHVDDYVLSSSRAISDNIQTKQKTDWD